MSKTILITGASGLIGKPLTRLLLKKGHTIHILSRSPEPHGNPKIKVFHWDITENKIDQDCINGVDTIIHLAGEGIADKRWTAERKRKIINSRTESISMLYNLIDQKKDHQIKTIISSSAIGYYGDRKDELLNETSTPGDDFLARTCIEWESAVDNGSVLGLRIVKLRTSMVLTDEGGALAEMAKPIKNGIGAGLGKGDQWVSWIHIEDLIRMYSFVVDNDELEGEFNAASPNPLTNNELTLKIAATLNKKIWMPNIPAFALKLVLGELSTIVLSSTKVSSAKIESKGFKFNFPTIEKALKDIYSDN